MKLKISYPSPGEVQDMKKENSCVSCSGSGYYDSLNRWGRHITCSACGGTGNKTPDVKLEEHVTCYACDGEGYDDEELDNNGDLILCHICDGAKTVTVEW